MFEQMIYKYPALPNRRNSHFVCHSQPYIILYITATVQNFTTKARFMPLKSKLRPFYKKGVTFFGIAHAFSYFCPRYHI